MRRMERGRLPGVAALALIGATAVPACLLADGDLKSVRVPDGAVRVEVVESIPAKRSWPAVLGGSEKSPGEEFTAPAFGIVGVPRKYSRKGLIVDRTSPFLIRALGRVKLDAGRYQLLLRSFNAARLIHGDRVLASTRFIKANADGHEAVPDLPQASRAGLLPLAVGHAEELVELELEEGEHLFRLEAVVGGKNLRPEIGELVVAISRVDEGPEGERYPFRVLAPERTVLLNSGHWSAYAAEARARLFDLNTRTRRETGREEADYWKLRHESARRWLETRPLAPPPEVSERMPVFNIVDRFVGKRLEDAGKEPAPLVDDWTFLRRLSLDVRGVIPTSDEVEEFRRERSPLRRRDWIDRLLADPLWADHWVSYWQDVLAENPGILKPKLNNTGPFRWWIHESFLDNKPVDRFVTELVLMEGSVLGGGPAGFTMATQNDVPMAAKAHILGTAFLGVQLKCARCHDAPYHPWMQKDLFSIAAMLKREPQKVPESSSVPGSKEELEKMIVEVTLAPGSKVAPGWPFDDIAPGTPRDGLLRRPSDSRERLAAIVTSPENERFARVIANRVWKRYMGYGLVEPVDDWEGVRPSHAALLERLGRELVESGYDLKHLARLIFNSHAYQREARGDGSKIPAPAERWFAGPARRRLSAEQLLDSLFVVAGKSLGSEELNLDVDGRRPLTSFLNLGTPRRAWEFASLSNERDRPALSLPVAQSIIDLLKTFGWRETRQDPLTVGQDEAMVLQPLVLANGIVGRRIVSLSDDSAITRLCLEERDLAGIIRAVYLRFYTRPPTEEEKRMFVDLLAEGFDERIVDADGKDDLKTDGGVAARESRRRHAVSWSNHLSAEATRIKLEMERIALEGDPPTRRLAPDWRRRMEDAVWALVNSPEFVFVP